MKPDLKLRDERGFFFALSLRVAVEPSLYTCFAWGRCALVLLVTRGKVSVDGGSLDAPVPPSIATTSPSLPALHSIDTYGRLTPSFVATSATVSSVSAMAISVNASKRSVLMQKATVQYERDLFLCRLRAADSYLALISALTLGM